MLTNSESTLNLLEDIMTEGLICIDNQGIIQLYSDKAKEIFGIKTRNTVTHPPGKIQPKDLVIMIDYAFSLDDGALTSDDLSILGIHEPKLEANDLFFAVGLYKSYEHTPFYRVVKPEELKSYQYNVIFQGQRISLEADTKEKHLTIKVNDQSYSMNYIHSLGFIVILDGNTFELKFCQDNGYTAREESIGDLLREKSFLGKGPEYSDFTVIGKSLDKVHHSESMIQKFLDAARGKEAPFKEQFEIINGVPTICSSYHITVDGKIVGAALKVEDISKVRQVIEERNNLIEELDVANRRLFEHRVLDSCFPKLVGTSKSIQDIKRLALRASESDLPVFLSGESGTGKSLIASLIHKASGRKNDPFIHIYCGSRDERELTEELFGSKNQMSAIERAQSGTLFLDEIEALTDAMQFRLFRILEEGTFRSFIGTEKKNRLRLITATKKNLEKEILAGNFRDDLYYKIHILPIWLSPLRDRKEDLRDLTNEFLKSYPKKQMTTEAFHMLLNYDWPGNIRELENIIIRSALFSTNNLIFSKDLQVQLMPQPEVSLSKRSFREEMEAFEKQLLENALYRAKGDKKLAMEELKLSKTTFYEKLRRFSIEVK
ncbi:sigma 54-interacting transcriptional regulator [Guggenheimella bovis]